MDRQIINEFNRLYFSKKQLERRIYDKEELEYIWKIIEKERGENSVEILFKEIKNVKLWFNITDDIKKNIEFIKRVNGSELLDYLPNRSKSKFLEANIKIDINSNLELNKTNLIDGNLDSKILSNIYDVLQNIESYGVQLNINSIKQIYLDIFKEDNAINEAQIKDILEFLEVKDRISPIIKIAIVYFYIIRFKPFSKYSDIMAGILTYMYLIRQGYGIFKYCSQSHIILGEQKKYYNAIENSRCSNGDITYFIRYYINSMKLAIDLLNKDVNCKYGKKIIKELLERNNVFLENRQIDFINKSISTNNKIVTIEDYKRESKVSYETARTDLNNLITLGFFKINKAGKKYEYYFNDIPTIIESFEE
ncbi:MAG: Fic family protein [Clostridium septicum]|uniref:Fic family protein n=1 Tax=Clostridium septicum TaxID=1504 RepID=UPI0025828CE1|nr:Fic family protein [Clostridium septicum]MDU1313270.1 Fic family protein [Clostridium septicum]